MKDAPAVALVESSPVLRKTILTGLSSAGFGIANPAGGLNGLTPTAARVLVIDAAVAVYLGQLLEKISVIVTAAPTPVGCAAAAAALLTGAVDVVLKPTTAGDVDGFLVDLRRKIELADRFGKTVKDGTPRAGGTVAIGGVCNGVAALQRYLSIGGRPHLAALHLPAGVTPFVVKALQNQFDIVEAADGQAVEPGRTLLAPGGRHLTVHVNGSKLFARVKDGPARGHGRPSIDLMFESLAATSVTATALMLTETDIDGLAGLAAFDRKTPAPRRVA